MAGFEWGRVDGRVAGRVPWHTSVERSRHRQTGIRHQQGHKIQVWQRDLLHARSENCIKIRE